LLPVLSEQLGDVAFSFAFDVGARRLGSVCPVTPFMYRRRSSSVTVAGDLFFARSQLR
jgi:hypothetical protein